MKITPGKYKESDPGKYLIFTHRGHEDIVKALAGRLAYLCQVKGNKLTITRGFVTAAEQKAVGDNMLKANPTWYRSASGAVYNGAKCMASAPGNSNHEFRHAVDSGDTWFKALTNVELAGYGLYKPMAYEPWHVQLIETKGVSKNELREESGDDEMDVKDFQRITGLVADGIAGAKTKAKAQEVLVVVQQILGIPDLQKLQGELNQAKNDMRIIKETAMKW